MTQEAQDAPTASPAVIRKLTEEEREIFGGAVIRAANILPSFRDVIALIRPFYDGSASTAYTDKHSRVGLSHWFFHEIDASQRASVILHETYHVLNNTFTRGDAIPQATPQLINLSSDLEINSTLDKHPSVDLSFGVMPDKAPFSYDRYLTMEQYYTRIKNDPEMQKPEPDPNCEVHGEGGQDGSKGDAGDQQGEDESGQEGAGGGAGGDSSQGGSGGQGSESGQGGSGGQSSSGGKSEGGDQEDGADGSGSSAGDANHEHGDSGPKCSCPSQTPGACDPSTEEREAGADEAGIERASAAEQSIAKKNTAVKIEEALKELRSRNQGNGHLEDMLSLTLKNMAPPKVDWRKLFRRIVAKLDDTITRGRADYSYRRPSRRLSDSKFIFPGMVKYNPKIMFGVDTSGSMSMEDHQRTAYEVEGVLKAINKGKDSLKVFSVDTKVSNIKPVDNVAKLNLRGGGGTEMSVAWAFARSLPSREQPDIFILSTDGFTSWDTIEAELDLTAKSFSSVILITTSLGYAGVPESVRRKAHVVDISEGER